MAAELVIGSDPGQVWRIGFRPDPWAWSDWKYADGEGRFGGRWDDSRGQFRTLYTGVSLYACLVEVLAPLRPAPWVEDDIMGIDDPDDQGGVFTEYPAGTIDHQWVADRQGGRAVQSGRYCHVTHSDSVAVLRRLFDPARFGAAGAEFDTALLKNPQSRGLTRAIARWLYDQQDPPTGDDVVDGVEFVSRHGDELRLWAVFERPADGAVSSHLREVEYVNIAPETPELVSALELHGISWA